ncbi:MAG: NAD-dependent protein deacylase [Gemmatimonadetes bacterium]|nr:MAG: NAD-dependent protein deacylase [Gemmatimonadota bacterium]
MPRLDASTAEKIIHILQSVEKILVITGAGISAESGLPTYRGIGGLYHERQTEDNMPIETALSGHMMRMKPEISWKYIAQIEAACRGATFNRAHEVIVEMEDQFEKVCVLTQNVDGFHRAAGSRNVIDIHGDIHDLYCLKCRYRTTVKDYAELEIPPHCPDCGSTVRPDVVLFGEMLPGWKYHNLMKQLQDGFDVVFSIGTSSLFPYIAAPVINAKIIGIPTIEINPGHSEVSDVVDLKIEAKAAETLDQLWNMFQHSS